MARAMPRGAGRHAVEAARSDGMSLARRFRCGAEAAIPTPLAYLFRAVPPPQAGAGSPESGADAAGIASTSGAKSRYITGVTKRLRIVELIRPPTITQARGE